VSKQLNPLPKDTEEELPIQGNGNERTIYLLKEGDDCRFFFNAIAAVAFAKRIGYKKYSVMTWKTGTSIHNPDNPEFFFKKLEPIKPVEDH